MPAAVGRHLMHDQVEQIHLDFIIRWQDLWDDMLTPVMVRIIARALASCLRSTTFTSGSNPFGAFGAFGGLAKTTPEKEPVENKPQRGIWGTSPDGKWRRIQLNMNEKDAERTDIVQHLDRGDLVIAGWLITTRTFFATVPSLLDGAGKSSYDQYWDRLDRLDPPLGGRRMGGGPMSGHPMDMNPGLVPLCCSIM